MPKIVVIVESPAKCKKIESFLGPGYSCIASFGHIQELKGLKCIDIDNHFKPTFNMIEGKKQQITKIKKLVNNCDEILIATDDDREGEAIGWHICEVLKQPVATTKRIIFHEVTKTALQNAVQNPTIINMDIVRAQQARQILDLLVGYKISPILWSNISRNSKSGLSAGRCQTPALRLVYDNQNEINQSPGTKVYNTVGYFTKNNLPFQLDFHHDSEEKMEEFLEDSVNHDHIYSCGKPRKTTKNPPSPFTTSTLQQTASNELHYSPKNTMMICQKLYEGGYITYMRTDSKTYSKEFIQTANHFIQDKWGKEYVSATIDSLSERKQEKKTKKTKDPKKAKSKSKSKEDNKAQEAHEAIRPTNIKVQNVSENMDNKAKRMYQLIWRNTVESCMSPAECSSITAKITAPDNLSYKHSTELVIFPGWKIVRGYEKENPNFTYLQMIKDKSVIEYKKITAKITMKDLKMHYTEAKLVQILEQKGIGRPSTFSSLIDKIQERNYVKKENVKGKKIACIDYELVENEIEETKTEREFGNEKNKLVIQPLGIMVVEFLLKHFNNLFAYEYTKEMEDTLDMIAKGESIWYELCEKCILEIDNSSQKVQPKNREQYKIDDEHTFMIAKYGPVIKYTPKIKDAKVSFKSAKKDLDLQKLKDGKYKLEEILENPMLKDGKILGKYKKENLILKKGKFGLYVTWGKDKRSLNHINIEEDEINCENVTKYIEEGGGSNKNILRIINNSISIRNGKFGPYIFYKTEKMNKPKFLKLKGFQEDYNTCEINIVSDWITKTYAL